MNGPNVSAIVCTWGHVFSLKDALASLSAQTLPMQEYELIVVDNNPCASAEIGRIVTTLRSTAYASHPDHLRLVHCSSPGLSAARNAGIAESRGDILCFIDDDALASPDWLETLQAAFAAHPAAGVIGGHILLQPPEPRPRILRPGRESYWSQFIPSYAGYTEVAAWSDFPWGANWSARRKALLEIGGFRSSYGRRGSDYWGGEELVAAAQVQSLGYTVAVLPQARVTHNVHRSRFHLSHLWRTILASTLVTYRAQRDLYIPPQPASPGLLSALASSSHADLPVLLLRFAARLVLVLHRIKDDVFDRFHSPALR